MVKALGADRVIDYQTESLAEETAEFDVVYDTATNSGAGEDYRDRAIAMLAPPTPGNLKEPS